MITYTPPTPGDLSQIKSELGYSGEQMAALASVAGGQQWRKYTGGSKPRDLNMHMLFFMAARLTLGPRELAAIAEKMKAMGASIDAEALATLPGPRQ